MHDMSPTSRTGKYLTYFKFTTADIRRCVTVISFESFDCNVIIKFQENHEAVEFSGLHRLLAYAVVANLLAQNSNTVTCIGN